MITAHLTRWPLAALCLLLAFAIPASADLPAPEQALEQLRQATVEVTRGEDRHAFRVWIAETAGQRSRGLMFVRELEPDRGMLFLFDPPQFASFWMRNTYIPLDLVFVAPDGRIVNIVESATPLALTPLESVAPVTAVLEVAGGTTTRLGIRPGDQLEITRAP